MFGQTLHQDTCMPNGEVKVRIPSHLLRKQDESSLEGYNKTGKIHEEFKLVTHIHTHRARFSGYMD